MQTLKDKFITRNYILSLKAENNKGDNKMSIYVLMNYMEMCKETKTEPTTKGLKNYRKLWSK